MSAPDPRSIICPRCGAGVGANCTTRTGRQAHQSHADRSQPLWKTWSDGYKGGQDGLLKSPKWYAHLRAIWTKKQGGES